jgi:hypothetical protein
MPAIPKRHPAIAALRTITLNDAGAKGSADLLAAAVLDELLATDSDAVLALAVLVEWERSITAHAAAALHHLSSPLETRFDC